MAKSLRETLEALVSERVAAGEDPMELFEELLKEANSVFGHYDLEYEMGLFLKGTKTD